MDLMEILKIENLSGITGSDFYWKKPDISITYSLLISVSIVTGTIGNVLTITAVLKNSTLRTTGNYFILNLCFADLIVCSFVGPMNLTGIFAGEIFFESRPNLCFFIGALCLLACFASVWTIFFISCCRFTCIVKSAHYDRLYNHRNTLIFIFLSWMIAFLLTLPNYIGSNGYYFERKVRTCLWNRLRSYMYNLFFSLVAVGIPMIITLILYIVIFKHVIKSSKRVSSHSGSAQPKSKQSTISSNNLKLAKTMAFIYLAFLCNWGPYIFIISLDYYDTFSPFWHGLSLIFAHFNSSVNTFIYGFTNTSFKNAYAKLLGIERFLNRKGQTPTCETTKKTAVMLESEL